MSSLPPIPNSYKKQLLKLARDTLKNYLETGIMPKRKTKNMRMCSTEGAFVKIMHHGNLRGSKGMIESSLPLFETIKSMAIAAGTQDKNNSQMLLSELNELIFEISILSPLKPVNSLDMIILGIHGLVIRTANSEDIIFPEVALNNQWTKERFLAELCFKTGVEQDAWLSDPSCELFYFTVDVFSES